MKNIIFTLIVLVVGSLAYSQCDCMNCKRMTECQSVVSKSVVKGTVTDKDGEPALATMTITGSNLKNGFDGAQTDEQGSFGVQVVPGTYTVKVSQQGHVDHIQTIIVEVNKNLNLGTIHLKESPIEITNYYYGHETKEIVFNVVSISQMDIVKIASIEESESTTAAVSDAVSDVTKSSQGPFTGLEGHNFNEEPAIIYPNPVKGSMNVKSTDPITVIEILNIHGEIKKLLYINESMDVSDLEAGTYFARIHFENINDVQIERILIVQ